MIIDKTEINDTKIIAEKFNKYFVNIEPSLLYLKFQKVI